MHNLFSEKESDAVEQEDIEYLPTPESLSDGRSTDELNQKTSEKNLLEIAQKHMFGGQ
ncbi:hypothetical protein [Bifidobacterium aquikefiri]|uniref:hypothetical protein n=1 Tax=Bifidobacterium aquikefiri TaxID=1653207 RepID=UPI0039EBB114